jgi:hypothetical protein
MVLHRPVETARFSENCYINPVQYRLGRFVKLELSLDIIISKRMLQAGRKVSLGLPQGNILNLPSTA